MTPKILSEVEEAEVVARYQAGLTERQLADRFGVDRNVVRRALDRAGVDRRPQSGNLERRSDVATDDIVRLRGEGMSWFQIARAVGMKPSGVRRRWEAAGHKVVTEPPEMRRS